MLSVFRGNFSEGRASFFSFPHLIVINESSKVRHAWDLGLRYSSLQLCGPGASHWVSIFPAIKWERSPWYLCNRGVLRPELTDSRERLILAPDLGQASSERLPVSTDVSVVVTVAAIPHSPLHTGMWP